MNEDDVVVAVERVVAGGDGLGRLPDGRVVFVPGAMPGDKVRLTTIEDRRSYVRAPAFEWVEPSKERTTPRCPHIVACGGCDLMALESAAQRRVKESIVREAFGRIGRFDPPPELAWGYTESRARYRTRLRLHFDEAGNVGLFARGTREVVPVTSCDVALEPVEAALLALREVVDRDREAFRECEAVEVRTTPDGSHVLLRFETRRRLGPQARAALESLQDRYAVSAPGLRSDHVRQRYSLEPVAPIELVVPDDAFVQVNWNANLALLATLVEGARARGVKRFCDLYSGVGNLAFALLHAGMNGSAFERHNKANASARTVAKRHGFVGAEFIAGPVEQTFARLLRQRPKFDLLVVDPPRSGAKALVSPIARSTARFVAMCSCDPVTLARDARGLVDAGFVLESVTLFDMFPETHHVEALAWFSRAPTAAASDG